MLCMHSILQPQQGKCGYFRQGGYSRHHQYSNIQGISYSLHDCFHFCRRRRLHLINYNRKTSYIWSYIVQSSKRWVVDVIFLNQIVKRFQMYLISYYAILCCNRQVNKPTVQQLGVPLMYIYQCQQQCFRITTPRSVYFRHCWLGYVRHGEKARYGWRKYPRLDILKKLLIIIWLLVRMLLQGRSLVEIGTYFGYKTILVNNYTLFWLKST